VLQGSVIGQRSGAAWWGSVVGQRGGAAWWGSVAEKRGGADRIIVVGRPILEVSDILYI